jgi:hypothetical protein
VRIDVHDDGSGTVTVEVVLDGEAAKRLGDVDEQLSTEDLEAAGWKRSPAARRGDDTVVSVSKPFRSAEDLPKVLAEVSGDVFGGFTVEVEDGFARTTWSVRGTVTVSGDLAQFGDERLAAALDGLPLGRTPEELAAEFGGEPTVPLSVEVRLPTAVDDEARGARAVDARTRAWSVDLASGGEQRRPVAATGSGQEAGPLRWFAVAALLLVSAGIWRVVRAMRAGRTTSGRVAPPGSPDDVPPSP